MSRKSIITQKSRDIGLTKSEKFKIDANRRRALERRARGVPMVLSMPNVRFDNNVRRATPQEVNYVDLASANYNLDTTGGIALIATIAQGASVNQRIGKRAYYKSLLIRGFVSANTTATINDIVLMIVYDKRPTGALPLITDILTAVNSRAFMNDNNTARFEVIRRMDDILLGNTTTPTTGKEAISHDHFIPLNKRPITFEAVGTGAIGDIDMGALYFVAFGSNAAGTTAATATLSFRTRFTEQ